MAGVLVGTAVALSADRSHEEGLREAIRLTGRISFLFFLVPWSARPLDILLAKDWTAEWVERRGQFGLALIGNHCAHLALIALLYDMSDDPPVDEWVRIGGLLGTFDLAAMGILSFPGPVRAAGPRVTRLVHRFVLHVLIWLFFYDLALKNGFGAHPLLLPLWFAACGLRMAAWLVERRRAV